ncbi:MAG: glycosyltransferase family 2 protein [Vicinamibacterales bacterium]
MSTAAVIVNWNAGASLESCLRSLEAQRDDGTDLAVIVIDNASTDDSVDRARAASPEAQFVANVINVGFAPAVNMAVAHAPADSDILLLNPDARLDVGSLYRLVGELQGAPGVGIVGPRIVGEDGQLHPMCARSDLSLETLLYELAGLRRFWPRRCRFGAYRLERWDHRGVRDVPCLSGACMLVRRSVFNTLGGLDETLPMYFEDIDLCARARASGWLVRFVGDATLVHEGARSAAAHPQRMRLLVMEEGDARWLFFRRHRGRLQAFLASIIIAAGASARYVAAAAATPAACVLAGPSRCQQLASFKRKYRALAGWSLSRDKPVTRLRKEPL